MLADFDIFYVTQKKQMYSSTYYYFTNGSSACTMVYEIDILYIESKYKYL